MRAPPPCGQTKRLSVGVRRAPSTIRLLCLFRSSIFYRACLDIPRGSELLVWYNDSYTSFFGIPLQCVAQDENRERLSFFYLRHSLLLLWAMNGVRERPTEVFMRKTNHSAKVIVEH